MVDWQADKEQIQNVISASVDKLVPFQDHPFRVASDEEMEQLEEESIREYGVLSPLVRPAVTAAMRLSAVTAKQMSQAGTLTRQYLHHLLTEEKPNQRQKFLLDQEEGNKRKHARTTYIC